MDHFCGAFLETDAVNICFHCVENSSLNILQNISFFVLQKNHTSLDVDSFHFVSCFSGRHASVSAQ